MQNYKQRFLFFFFSLVIYSIAPFSNNLFVKFVGAEQIKLVGLDEISLEKDVIVLKDVAHIYTENSILKEKLEQIEIGETPPLGRTKIIDEKDIRLFMKRANIEVEQTEIVLTSPISVTRASIEISSEFIKTAVTDYIHTHNRVQASTLAIKDIGWSGRVILPKGEFTYKIEPRYQTVFIGNVPLIFFFKIDGQVVKRLSVVAKLEIVANVVVARNPINRGQIIKSSDLNLRSSELSKIKGRPVLDIDTIIDKRAVHQIYSGAVILDDDVEIPPVVKRGDTVKIIVLFSNLIATARGLVKENGKIGQKIKVINIDSKKLLYAEVIDKHTVKIEF